MMTSIRMEQRSAIKYCVKACFTPTQTYDFISKAESSSNVCRSLVSKWHKLFSDGRQYVEDISRPGSPSTDNGTIEKVREIVNEDRRKTVVEIAEEAGIGKTTTHKILTENLNMRKVSARWVPRLLNDEERLKRVETSQEFLQRWKTEGDAFLGRIITCDETWIHNFDPETKQESMVWKTPSSPPPKKARVSKSAQKTMFIFFNDQRGMLLSHAAPRGVTVNASYYQKVIRRDLVHAFRKKRPGKEIEDMILHQDNAPAHRADETLMTIDFVGLERLSHSPYSPDLAPMDFAVFPKLKSELRGQRYTDVKEIQLAVRSFVKRCDESWYRDIYSSLVSRHRRCVQCNGEYFEKL